MTGDDLDMSNLIRARRREIEAHRRDRLIGALAIIVAAIIVAVFVVTEIAEADVKPAPDVAFAWPAGTTAAEHGKRINDFLAWFFASCSPRRLARAHKVVPVLLVEAESAGVNPALVAAIVTLESTWRVGAVGSRGEVGLMQLIRRGAPTEPAANLRAGIALLVESYRQCGTTYGAVSMYATGETCAWDGAARRLRLAARIEGAR